MEAVGLLKTDSNKILNMHHMRWFAKQGSCFEVCTKSNGCTFYINTHKVCKEVSPMSYARLEELYKNAEH